jgi:ApbE superfamily uncharacterized protein (UPF0280 family)
LLSLRSDIEQYIECNPEFKSSFTPLEILPDAPKIVLCMGNAAKAADVGPMASVAGAIAEALGEEISGYCKEAIIENGGDLYIKSCKKRLIAIDASKTKFSNKIGLEIGENEPPHGICTSSGTIGASISLGKADVVVIRANTASLADAVATATANRIMTPQDMKSAIEFAKSISGVNGVLAIKDHQLAVWGNINLTRIQ